MTAAKAKPKSHASEIGHSRDDFRNTFDKSHIVPQRISEGLAKLPDDRYLEDIEFSKLIGVVPRDITPYREQFEDYIVEARPHGKSNSKRLWCGSVDLAEELRGYYAAHGI